MIWNSLYRPRCIGQLFGAAALACALSATPAKAGVLDFETPVDSPFVFAGDIVTLGNYNLQGYGTAGLVGAIGTTDNCADGQCPVNNPTTYYSALADGYFVFGLANGSAFTLASLDASFVGGGLASYPSVAALLYITAFNASGLIIDEIYLALDGPTGGNFNFASYDLSSFGGGTQFAEVRIASYACDVNGDCNRNTNQAQFAIDNIVTVDASGDVPEPGTLALLGLGLLGLRSCTRRRAV